MLALADLCHGALAVCGGGLGGPEDCFPRGGEEPVWLLPATVLGVTYRASR